MRLRTLGAIGSVTLAVAVALPGAALPFDLAPAPPAFAQQASGDETADQEPLDQGTTLTDSQPAGDYEALDGPVTTAADGDAEPLDAGPVPAAADTGTTGTAPSAAADTSGTQAPAAQSGTGQAQATTPEAATATPGSGAWWWWTRPHRCVVAQSGRAYAAVNCADGMPVQVGFAPPGSGPVQTGVTLGSATATPTPTSGGGSVAMPATATPTPVATAEPTATSTPTTSKRKGSGGSSSANQDGSAGSSESDAQTAPLVTFGNGSGTVQRVRGATIVTGEARSRAQRIIRKRNGIVSTDDQSGSNGGNGGRSSASANGGTVGVNGASHNKNSKKKDKHKNKKDHKKSKQKDKQRADRASAKAKRKTDRKQQRSEQRTERTGGAR